MVTLRMAADWRFLNGLPESDTHSPFQDYFKTGYLKTGYPKKMTVPDWTKTTSEGAMPEKILDRRAIGAGKAEAAE
jgi:hypothetical protein